jgi:hypothetical protein
MSSFLFLFQAQTIILNQTLILNQTIILNQTLILNSKNVEKKLERKQTKINNKNQHSRFEAGIAAGESGPEPTEPTKLDKIAGKNLL